MALVAVSLNAGYVFEVETLLRILWRLLKANMLGVINVVAAVELLRPFGRRLQEVFQGRHGTVVQIRGPQPQPVKRHRHVAIRADEMAKMPRVGGPVMVVAVGGLLAP